MASATPLPGDLNTSRSIVLPSSPTNLMVSVALAGEAEIGGAVLVAVGVAADDDGLVQPGTRRGTLRQMIGSRKMTPPRMLRIVPLGLFHISFRSNSLTRASSGVIVAHLTPTPCFLMALAASIVT